MNFSKEMLYSQLKNIYSRSDMKISDDSETLCFHFLTVPSAFWQPIWSDYALIPFAPNPWLSWCQGSFMDIGHPTIHNESSWMSGKVPIFELSESELFWKYGFRWNFVKSKFEHSTFEFQPRKVCKTPKYNISRNSERECLNFLCFCAELLDIDLFQFRFPIMSVWGNPETNSSWVGKSFPEVSNLKILKF